MSVKTYTYCGPESLHSLIGQVMASLAMSRSGKPRRRSCHHPQDDGSHLYVGCTFTDDGRSWSSEIGLLSKEDPRKIVKDCLIHWHQRFLGHGPGPWGTLIGVRPTKLVHHLFDQGLDEKAAEKVLTDDYDVAEKTARDLVAMAQLQRPYVTDRGRKLALYVGIPYCPSHCLYCSFPSRLIGGEGRTSSRPFAMPCCETSTIWRLFAGTTIST